MAQCQSRLHRSFRNDCDDGRQTGFGEDAPADAHICLYLYFHARTHLVEIFYSRRRVDTISAIRVIAALFWVTTNCQETRNFATGNKQYHNMTKIALGTWALPKACCPSSEPRGCVTSLRDRAPRSSTSTSELRTLTATTTWQVSSPYDKMALFFLKNFK
jgi:hypothetical protein